MPLRSVGCAPDSANVKPEPSLAIERLLSLFGYDGFRNIPVVNRCVMRCLYVFATDRCFRASHKPPSKVVLSAKEASVTQMQKPTEARGTSGFKVRGKLR